MAKIYYNQIKAGKMTLDEVPSKWYDQVKALLDADDAITDSEALAQIVEVWND